MLEKQIKIYAVMNNCEAILILIMSKFMKNLYGKSQKSRIHGTAHQLKVHDLRDVMGVAAAEVHHFIRSLAMLFAIFDAFFVAGTSSPRF